MLQFERRRKTEKRKGEEIKRSNARVRAECEVRVEGGGRDHERENSFSREITEEVPKGIHLDRIVGKN